MDNSRHYIQLFEKYLRNEASEQEKETLVALLRNDRRIQHFFENELENAHPTWDEETATRIYDHVCASISSQKKHFSISPLWRKAMQWAAILVLPILSALAIYHFAQGDVGENQNPVTITAAYGEKAEVKLADGSHVWLNSGSSLTYDNKFNRKERDVYLHGEAYFEVAKDKKRPFIVKTTAMNIEALGTAFNVSAYDNESSVSSVLLEGSIKITTGEQERVLAENERATFHKTHRTLVTDRVYASDFVQWKNGNLYFENRSFEEIANTLARVFNVEIRFASQKLRPIRFSGTLGNSSIRNALDILSLTSPMRYEMRGTTIELHYGQTDAIIPLETSHTNTGHSPMLNKSNNY